MNITFTDRKMDSSGMVREYAEKKCSKLAPYFDGEVSVQITFSHERGMHTAEITMHTQGLYFRAQERTGNMYASIDGAIASIDKQIQKNKTKLSKRLRQESFVKAMGAMTDYSDESFEIVREKFLDVKPMTIEDAILQMNLLGHTFFFFINSEKNGAPCVVYARNNGGYGLLIAKK
ncbi:MAG: ribosome-associated translation inhibitor RaiA [Clostridia bacterium]|nr:ribosome-associated translation inhibitor RaiA [Clostridia bacterium]